MTGRDVYHRALSLLNEQSADDSEQYDTKEFEAASPALINVLCVMLDELDLHIKRRSFHSAEYQPRQIASLDEELYLHPILCMGALPLVLAFFLIAEENASRAGLFFNLFQSEKEMLRKRYCTVRRHKIKSMY